MRRPHFYFTCRKCNFSFLSKQTLMQRLISFLVFFLLQSLVKAQLPANAFSFNCTKDTATNCGENCLTIKTKVPAIGALSNNYTVSKTDCFRPNVSPATPGISLGSTDDRYSPVLNLPFTFSFYNAFYNQLAVSSNGMISFDLDNANLGAQWAILTGSGSLPDTDYDRAVIMGAYHDVDIQFPTTSPDKQIKYEVTGTAPHRKWVLSFYKVPCYSNTCWNKINNTYQVTLYEGIGLVEVHVFERDICATWNSGNAMIGMQNYDRTNGIMAPGRSAWTSPQWGGLNMNEAWRFAPKDGAPLLKKVELYTTTNQLVATGDTANDGNGNYNVSFNNICLASNAVTYLVKTTYKKIDDAAAEVYAVDTINVVNSSSIIPTVQVQNACAGMFNGSITVTNPVGSGYAYSINGATYQVSPVFSFLPAGTYAIAVNTNTGCLYNMVAQVNTGYQANSHITYPRNVYCNQETITPAPVIDGGTGGVFSVSPSGLNLNASTGAIDIAASDTGSYIVSYTFTPADSCINPIATTEIRIVANNQFVWTGAVDNSWENPANWSCNNLPTASANVIIYSGNVVVNSDVTVNTLTVRPGASITINSGFNLNVITPGN
jgi:hypothetical protein